MRARMMIPYILVLGAAGLSGGILLAAGGSTAAYAENLPRSDPRPEPQTSGTGSAAGQSGSAPLAAAQPGTAFPATTLAATYLPSVDASTAGAALTAAALPSPGRAPMSATANAPLRAFPALWSPQIAQASASGIQSWPHAFDPSGLRGDDNSLIPELANNIVLAFYGHPESRRMGILGEYPKEELAALLKGYARAYRQESGKQGVIPAFYLIYGTCWPEGEIGYLRDSLVKEYIDFAAQEGMLVFVDHQIGKYSVEEATKRLLPWLQYPNVHLALDPEWRTLSPKKEIGTISATELNKAQAMIQDYLVAQGIPGTRMLVVHQFEGGMITDRASVRADFERVILVHTADGFGPPALKRSTYFWNAKATNMPLKGFKLFFKTEVPGAGWDDPLLSPAEVLALDPKPAIVIYQ